MATYRKSSMPRIASPQISDAFWAVVEPLLPIKERAGGHHYQRQPGAGRKPIPARQAFEAIVYVLRTGTPWKALPRSFGSASAVHRHFDAWHAGGLFTKLWQAGLAEHDEMEGIAWRWRKSPPPPAHDDAAFIRASVIASADPTCSTSRALTTKRDWQPSLARRRPRKHPRT